MQLFYVKLPFKKTIPHKSEELLSEKLGSFSISDGDISKKVISKMNLCFFNFVMFISIHWKCQM